MIYFIERSDGRIKIGTTIRVSMRLAQLSIEHKEKLKLLAVTAGSFVEEKKLHTRFAHLRVEGEWFVPMSELLDFIREHADEWDGKDEAVKLISVKLHEHIVHQARICSAISGRSISDLVSDILEEPLRQLEEKEIEKRLAKRLN